MTLNRRSLLVSGGAALGGALASGAAAQTAGPASGIDGSRSAALFLKDDDGSLRRRPTACPSSGTRGERRPSQAHLSENGFAGVWLSDPMNIIYFTGLFFTTTERPFAVFLPADKLATIWFNPGLDRDLVKSWWAPDPDSYFDFQHAEGAFPNEGKVQQGAKVDLFEWVLKGLKKRGYDGKRIATDKDLSAQAALEGGLGLPEADDVRLGRRPLREDADGQVARGARALAARLPGLRRDARLRPRPVARERHGPDRLRARHGRDRVRHGAPDVRGSSATAGRTRRSASTSASSSGAAWARPIRTRTRCTTTRSRRARRCRSRAGSTIGGCGGELYRAFLLAPWTDHQKKVWTVARDCCLMQKDLSREGVACSTVAYQIHKHQVKEGMAEITSTTARRTAWGWRATSRRTSRWATTRCSNPG